MTKLILLLCYLAAFSFINTSHGQISFTNKSQKVYKLTTLSANQSSKIAQLSDIGRYYSILRNVLKVRVPGLPRSMVPNNHYLEVQRYLIYIMRSLKWDVALDEFVSETPYGLTRFTNIVATLDPNAPERFIIACHYDSKYFPRAANGKSYVGATDSAAPCSMIIDSIAALNDLLKNRTKANNTTLQLIFFDGEEAFVKWTKTDSLYGSRHLVNNYEYITGSKLTSIRAFILLDLIGSTDTQFRNLYPATSQLFEKLQDIEKRLSEELYVHQPYFRGKLLPNLDIIEDDHLPFIGHGVPALHLISVPFPKVWHTYNDDATALDWYTMDNLNKILRVFIAECLHL